MRDRILSLTGEDVEKLVAVLAHAEARTAIGGDQDMETWCHGMLDRLRDAE